MRSLPCTLFFFFNDTATTEIYTLPLHDALPILPVGVPLEQLLRLPRGEVALALQQPEHGVGRGLVVVEFDEALADLTTTRRSEEHTSELQSQSNIVCRLLLENKQSSAPGYGAQP